MGVVSLSEVAWSPDPDYIPLTPEEAEHREFARVHACLPDGWLGEEECENRIARILGFNDHELPARASLQVGEMVRKGWLMKRAGERRAEGPKYCRVEEPPELLTPQQIIEREEEHQAKNQRESRAREAAANARKHEEKLAKEHAEEDQAFQACAERSPLLAALEARLADLEGR